MESDVQGTVVPSEEAVEEIVTTEPIFELELSEQQPTMIRKQGCIV